jgi:hypothetical protein
VGDRRGRGHGWRGSYVSPCIAAARSRPQVPLAVGRTKDEDAIGGDRWAHPSNEEMRWARQAALERAREKDGEGGAGGGEPEDEEIFPAPFSMPLRLSRISAVVQRFTGKRR